MACSSSSSKKQRISELEKKQEEMEYELQQVRDQLDAKNGQFDKFAKELAKLYSGTLPGPNACRSIVIDGCKYSPGLEAFIRFGAQYCRYFSIFHGSSDGFVDYPSNFFNDLVKYCYETSLPQEMIGMVYIKLPRYNSAPWPTLLVQLLIGELGYLNEEASRIVPPALKEEWVDHAHRRAHYSVRNKHKPHVQFQLFASFEGDVECYRQMTGFYLERKG